MAPIPAESSTSLVHFMNKSPALFWTLLTLLTVSVLCLASWAITRAQRRYKPAVAEWVERLNDPYTIGPQRRARFSLLYDDAHRVVGLKYKPHGAAAPDATLARPPATWSPRQHAAPLLTVPAAAMPPPQGAGAVRDWAAEYQRRLRQQAAARAGTQRSAYAQYQAAFRPPAARDEPGALGRSASQCARKPVPAAFMPEGARMQGAVPCEWTPDLDTDSGSSKGSPTVEECVSPAPQAKSSSPAGVEIQHCSSPVAPLGFLPSLTKAFVKDATRSPHRNFVILHLDH